MWDGKRGHEWAPFPVSHDTSIILLGWTHFQLWFLRGGQIGVFGSALDPQAVIDEMPKSPIERRKRNLIFFSPISRRERETWNSFPQFREGKEKCEKGFSTFEKWKRKGYSFLKFREEKKRFFLKNLQFREEKDKFGKWKMVLHFWEENGKCIFYSQASRGKWESWKQILQIREEKENF